MALHAVKTIIFMLFLTLFAVPVFACELVDHGASSQYFYDGDTGLYWFDTATFFGWPRTVVDNFITSSTIWNWATSAQIDALNGHSSVCGLTLEEVMGPRQITVGSGSPRWLGFHSLAAAPDGWLVQAMDSPARLDYTGSQLGAAGLDHGSWVVSSTDPVTALRLENCGNNGEFFLDQQTSIYWMDPAHFAGITRTEIDQWLLANPAWRWASQTQVWALADRLTVGDVPLVDVMGEPQFVADGLIPRWIGYYDVGGETDGVILQAGGISLLDFPGYLGTQGSIGSWNPGAWIITEDEPTPAENKSWGTLKALFK